MPPSPAMKVVPPPLRRWGPATFWTIVFLISQANLMRHLGALDPSFFAMQFTFTQDAYKDILEVWGPGGVEQFREHFQFDLIHPLLFALLGWVTVRTSPLFHGYDNSSWRLVLPVAAACDYCENLCQLQLLNNWALDPTEIEDRFVLISGVCASVKWMLATAFILVLLKQLITYRRADSADAASAATF